MGALASKLESAYRTQEISNTIAQSVPLLQNCMKKMDAIGVRSLFRVTLCQVAGSVGDFEKLFEDMDVKTEEMNGALDNVYATSIDNNEVMNLLNEMRDQQQMEVGGAISNSNKNAIANPNAAQTNDMDAMQAKLNELKNL